jgi:hypothetical protein
MFGLQVELGGKEAFYGKLYNKICPQNRAELILFSIFAESECG